MMTECKHQWREEINACCEHCGQRHNNEFCRICLAPKSEEPIPSCYPLNIYGDELIKKHYIRYIQQQNAFAPNPIDEEEVAAMKEKLVQYRRDLYLMTKKVECWGDFIRAEMTKEYFKEINRFLLEEEKQHTIYPPKDQIFKAFELCPLDKVKIIILGQDPYQNKGDAMGMCFSVPDDVKIPPSLRNIFSEINSDLKTDHKFKSGNLTEWARQGVFLLNSSLTVREGKSGSHSKIGWHKFSDAAIKLLDGFDKPFIYMFWGAHARMKADLVKNKKSLILQSGHPSPINTSKDFFGNNHFSRANEFLSKNNLEPINWTI